MSKIGKRPVTVPAGVTITAGAGFFEVKGAKGTVRRALPEGVSVSVKGNEATVSAADTVLPGDVSRVTGTARSHLNNAVVGVTKGYSQGIKLEGTGYKAELKGQVLTMSLGLSHPAVYELPAALKLVIPGDSKNTVLLLETADKDLLGQVVANLQRFRPPEPYKGKGVRLMKPGSPSAQPDLVRIRQKAGKAGKGGKGGK
ncbi:MAG: 50S ribosomal protein L6 [Polyangiales bacterium]